MKSAVIIFPGSNCDRDMVTVLDSVGLNPVRVWHAEASLPKVDLVVLPGGFSYGDYLRSGAMAANAPIIKDIIAHAEKGGMILGVCNGFQMLTECRLLPGALMRNRHLRFSCKTVTLKVEHADTPFTRHYAAGQLIEVPLAHHDGNFVADNETLDALDAEGRIAFRYCDANGEATDAANPNGSVRNIAGIVSKNKRILGMMPHPERHTEALLGGVDGRILFESLLAAA